MNRDLIRHPREGGDPVRPHQDALGHRLRGDDIRVEALA